jgi:hypothetical protein
LKVQRGRPSFGAIELAYYTVELPRPADGWGAVAQLSARAREVCDELSREGTTVRFVRSVFVPEDETCLYVYQAGSLEAVREAVRRAQRPEDRVMQAVVIPEGGGR